MIALPFLISTLMFTSSATTFVHHHNGGWCSGNGKIALTQKENYEIVHLPRISEAACRSRCEADTQCDFYQTFNHLAYAAGWPPHCQLHRNAYCDPEKLVTHDIWYQVWLKASAIAPVETVTSGAPMTASCSSQPLDYCLRMTFEDGNSPYAPAAGVWRLADVLNGEPVFVQDKRETANNGALGFHPNFNRGDLLANYCAGQTWGAVVLDKFPEYSFIVGGTFNWGIAGSCTGTETADILEVLRGQRDSITTAFRARTNSYHAAHRDVKIEVVRDVMECGGRFYSDALFSKTESEQCAIMETFLPKNPTLTPTANPTREPTNNPSLTPTANPTKEPTKNPTMNPTASPSFSPTKKPSMNPTLNPTASPSPFPTAADFIIKIKAFHGKPSDILDSDKIQAQSEVDVDLYSFEQKLTPLNGDGVDASDLQ